MPIHKSGFTKQNSIGMKGRGAIDNPTGRFEPYVIEADDTDNFPPGEAPAVPTRYFHDNTKSILARNDSPDIPFSVSINPYRGCEHGCIYCYARPTHEYLGLSAGVDFESKIFIKADAPKLLQAELSRRSWQPQIIAMSGVTDPYQPIERKLVITRGCLEVLARFRNPVGIVTKNHLITRDIDLLQELNEHRALAVHISLTTLDPHLARLMEPRASSPQRRLDAIAELADQGIAVNVMCAPTIPGLNDHELAELLKAAADAGAHTATYVLLRLPYGVKDLFSSWLDEHFPQHKRKILQRLEQTRDGRLNSTDYGSRMTGSGNYAEMLAQSFAVFRSRYGLDRTLPSLSTESFRRIEPGQGLLF